jgi:crossover junction endodeoxyribonuclease RuvC
MKILGIDPALTQLGWGVIECNLVKPQYIASGVIKTTTKYSIPYRLHLIFDSIEKIINLHKPDFLSMEETFINMNATSSLKLGYVRGVIMLLVGKYQLPFFEYKPTVIKKTVSCSGHADKKQVENMMKIILSEVPHLEYFDEADALAIAYTCLVYDANLNKVSKI